LSLPNTNITAAQIVTGGSFTLPGSPNVVASTTGASNEGRGGVAAQPSPGVARQEINGLPQFCRVAATLKPSADSDIRMEVWLPTSTWNGKYFGVGNGGFAGTISYAAMAPVLSRGYAVASTDTGHQGTGFEGSWAPGHPEKQIDFGYRAVHEMTLRAKAIVEAFYSSAPPYSYWSGCSTGGRQGLLEAQRFPADYDGMIAGAPVNSWNRLVTQIIGIKDAAATIPPTKYPVIHKAVMTRCDALDGVTDNILEDPRKCTFDPAVLQCKDDNTSSCLTTSEIAAVKKIYEPLRSPRTGEEVFPGLPVGSELNWPGIPRGFPIAENYYKYVVLNNPTWDFHTIDYDVDLAKAEMVDNAVGKFVAVAPGLHEFKKRGGKLIQYHGFGEPEIPPLSSINYRESLLKEFGARELDEFYSLFMVPGMAHCRGGVGATDQFDLVAALEQWVERGITPNRITASHMTNGVVDRTRPLCRFPQVARWNGIGSTDEAASFECRD
jgi:feruloyl esterase